MCDATGVASQLSLPVPGGKWVAWIKMKTLNISHIMPPIFFILLLYVWENNGLINTITGKTLTP